MNSDDIVKIQTQLLDVLPYWNHKIGKPFKQLFDNGISVDMYYAIRGIQNKGGSMTMSELAVWMNLSKQHTTKLVNKMVDLALLDRASDSADRRITNIIITEKAQVFVEEFLHNDAGCFKEMLQELEETERGDFSEALAVVMDILKKVSND